MDAASDKTCFVIAPIGEEDSDIRIRSDQILNHVITPAVTQCGYRIPVRADELNEPGDITSQVIQHVIDDDLVIADLTGHNPNVFYELAIRHAIAKPLVQIAQTGERIPFDVFGQRTVLIDHTNLDSVAKAIGSIAELIKAFESDDFQVDTPISMSLDLQVLGRSDNPEQRTLADILSELSSVRSTLSDLDIQGLETGVAMIRDEIGQFGRGRPRIPRVPLKVILEYAKGSGLGTEALPILLGTIRDDIPWLYEVGMEVHRHHAAGDSARAQRLAARLLELMEVTADMMRSGPVRQDALRHIQHIALEIAGGKSAGALPFE